MKGSDLESQNNDKLPKSKSLNFSGERPSTPILDTINDPIHMRNLSVEVINFGTLVVAEKKTCTWKLIKLCGLIGF